MSSPSATETSRFVAKVWAVELDHRRASSASEWPRASPPLTAEKDVATPTFLLEVSTLSPLPLPSLPLALPPPDNPA